MQRTRNVCFTLNNPPAKDEFIRALGKLPCTYWVFGQEVAPTTGTPHLQGYAEFSHALSSKRIKKDLGATIHLEPRRGSAQQAAEYCKKDGIFEQWGEISNQGNRSDIEEAISLLRTGGLTAVAEQRPAAIVRYHRGLSALHYLDLQSVERDPPAVEFYYGPGRCGKTRLAYGNGNGVAKLCLSSGWFDGYSGESTVILDDFDGAASKVPLSALLQYLDRYRVLVPVKGGFVPFVPTKIIITSNYHWKQWYDWSTRTNQYASLARRFTLVKAWARFGEAPLDITPDSEAFKAFMAGPPTTGVTVEDITMQDDIYYTFIDQ